MKECEYHYLQHHVSNFLYFTDIDDLVDIYLNSIFRYYSDLHQIHIHIQHKWIFLIYHSVSLYGHLYY